MQERVCAVVVTWNRKECLKKLLSALEDQSHFLEGIYIYDNHGDDGSDQMLVDMGFTDGAQEGREYCKTVAGRRNFYYRGSENLGGSGGFHNAFVNAMKYDWDYLWVMDDDVMPAKDCLRKLLNYMDETTKICLPFKTAPGYIDSVCIKYNLSHPFVLKHSQKMHYIGSDTITDDAVEICTMTFEGPLISTEIVKKIGYPDENYFIFFDDTDYAFRASRYCKIKYIKNAVIYKQLTQKNDFSWRNYYSLRNAFIFDRKYGKNWTVTKLRPWILYRVTYIYYKLKHDKLHCDTVKTAYKDAKNKIMGKTVIPGKLEDYLYK